MKSKIWLLWTLLCLLFPVSLPVRADDVPLRDQRREVFRVCPIDRETIVFLGNSITHFGVWPEMFGTDVKVVNRGISGIASGEVADHLDFVLDGQPKKLFLMIGINDNNQPRVVIPNIRRIIRTVKRESPSTEIYVESLLPCSRADRHGMVEGKNEELRQLCEEEGVTYVDVYSKVVDRSTTPPGILPEYTNDQLHVIGPGYRRWVEGFERYVGAPSAFTKGVATEVKQGSAIDNVENMLITQFQILPMPEGAMLHIGDYNVKTGEWAELMQDTKFLNRGMGLGWGYTHTIADLLLSVPEIVKGRPSRIFVQAGAKDFASGSTAETAFSNYEKAIHKIRELAPEAEIYMESIIPFTDATLNAKMAAFHEKLKAWAERDATDRIFYADVFGALSEGGVLATKFRGANTNQSKGINGRGYLRWANCLNEATGGKLNPRPELSDAQFALGEVISQALRMKYAASVGTEPGNYSAEAIASLKQAICAAKGVLYDNGSTDAQLQSAATSLTAALTAMGADIVKPQPSADEDEYWYMLSTPKRNAKYLQAEGVGQGAMGADVANVVAQQWKFVERPDGDFNLVSRLDGSYLTPVAAQDAQILTVQTEPANGWKIEGVGASGFFILSNGTVQLHQTNASKNWKIINWGGGSNTIDDGCLYRIERVTMEPEIVAVPESMLTLLDVELDGTKPYQVPAVIADPVLKAAQVTVAIDFTLKQGPQNACLVGASCSSEAQQYVGLLAANATHMAVRFNDDKGVYTREHKTINISTGRHQMVVTMQAANPSYSYYLDRTSVGTITAASTIFSTVPGVDGLYLGGLVCANNGNKYPAVGTIHSVQFFPGVLTAEQVGAIEYSDLTGISSFPSVLPVGSSRLYDLNGRRVTSRADAPGVYILVENGRARKVIR